MLKFKTSKQPYEFTVRNASNNQEYLELFNLVKSLGAWEAFGRKAYRYLYLDGFKYWIMNEDAAKSQVINRCKL